LGLTVDDITGLVLTIDDLSGEDAETLREWLDPIAEAVEAQLLVTDDADAFKNAADELMLDQQVCQGHVQRNTEALVESLQLEAAVDTYGSLSVIGIAADQAVADLKRLDELVRTRQPEDVEELADMHLRYIDASPPVRARRPVWPIVNDSCCSNVGICGPA
jgi:hypothetical protein